MSNFESHPKPLKKILEDIKEGKIQLPDFQRDWVWDDVRIRSLLISVARSFPVGTVMLLTTGGNVKFQARPLQGIYDVSDSPEQLILDGQQRLTTLTQVMILQGDTPVNTVDDKSKKIRRHYYINIKKSLEVLNSSGDWEDVVVSVDEDRQIKGHFGRNINLDVSTPEKEREHMLFPCRDILNSDYWEQDFLKQAPDKIQQYMHFREKILNAFREYQLPVITLDKSTSKEAVCFIFEKVNTGGISLDAFELITSFYAAENFNLRQDWKHRNEQLKKDELLISKKNSSKSYVSPTDFIQATTLLHTYEKYQEDPEKVKNDKAISPVSAQRETMLDLPLKAYKHWGDKIEKGFLEAANFLRLEGFHEARDIPYRTQLIPLAAIITMLGDKNKKALMPRIHEKLQRWFWCGVFGELYGGTTATRIANDMREVLEWIENDESEPPRTISDAFFQEHRLMTLRNRQSAAYKGLNATIIREGAQDFFLQSSVRDLYQEQEVCLDIHHIFPKKWCEKKGIDRKRYDSIINKTTISAKTNRMIGDKAPSKYLEKIQQHPEQNKSDDMSMDKILESHLISPKYMRTDDFDGFFTDRQKALSELIAKKMGKSIEKSPADYVDPDDDAGSDREEEYDDES